MIDPDLIEEWLADAGPVGLVDVVTSLEQGSNGEPERALYRLYEASEWPDHHNNHAPPALKDFRREVGRVWTAYVINAR